MREDLGLLVCGKSNTVPGAGDSELGEMLAHIRGSLDFVMDELSWLGTQEPRRMSMLGPFLGRSLLELSVTGLLGRLDPFRLLVVRQVQGQRDYDSGIPWKSSIRWQGDVLAKKVPNSGLWGDAVEYEKVTKALLGDYYDHLVWRPAMNRMLGATSSGARNTWLAELAALDVDSIVPRKREQISRLYSALSKGIHHEFVLPPGALYDRITIADLVQRSVHLIADIGLVSHFVAHAASSLGPEEAVEVFTRVEALELLR